MLKWLRSRLGGGSGLACCAPGWASGGTTASPGSYLRSLGTRGLVLLFVAPLIVVGLWVEPRGRGLHRHRETPRPGISPSDGYDQAKRP